MSALYTDQMGYPYAPSTSDLITHINA